jgi:hypothetical protein
MKDERGSPNRRIDIALNSLMKDVEKQPPDVAVKIIAAAISWERTKAKIKEEEGDFDPEAL